VKSAFILLAILLLSGCNRFKSEEIVSEDRAWQCISSNKFDNFYKEECEGKSIEVISFIKGKRGNALVMDRYLTTDPSYENYFEFKAQTDLHLAAGERVKIRGVLDDGDVNLHSIDLLQKSQEETEQFNKWARKAKIENMFSAWDGSQPDTVRAVKSSLHDPDSFEHVSTEFIDNGEYITVIMEYRANNSFGAKVSSVAIARVTENGSIQSITNN
jgi:hypothetical protein